LEAIFNDQGAEFGAWRHEFAFQLRLFSQWLKDAELWDAAVAKRIRRLEHWVVSDGVMVAFVAEFSRGKSELINALLFADYDRRILPIGAGRSTLCPTELGYVQGVAQCMRLLPIETRLQARTLAQWRETPDAWTTIALDVSDADQLSRSFERVTETILVTPAQAQALGLWHEQAPGENSPPCAQGLVEVPRWRHALVNISHPLLQRGLVILDTPGIDVLAREPETTEELLHQAHALVVVLGADSGVTRSELAIWCQQLRQPSNPKTATLVVLNKVDTLWDALSTPSQVHAQIEAQRVRTAQSLGLAREKVLALSAQKGLLAKVSHNSELLEKSGLKVLEAALAQDILGGRRVLVGAAINEGLASLQTLVLRTLCDRCQNLEMQRAELQRLYDKCQVVIRDMRARVNLEKQELDLASTKTRGIKAVHSRLFRELVEQLKNHQITQDMQTLARALGKPGLKWGVRSLYSETFERLRAYLQRIEVVSDELVALHAEGFLQLNATFGFNLEPPAPLVLDVHRMDLVLAERNHLFNLGLFNLLRLQKAEFVSRLIGTLNGRLKTLHATLRADAQTWIQSTLEQLNLQMQEQRVHLKNRLESLEKMERVAEGFVQRIHDLADRERALKVLKNKLSEQTEHLLSTIEDSVHQQAEVLS